MRKQPSHHLCARLLAHRYRPEARKRRPVFRFKLRRQFRDPEGCGIRHAILTFRQVRCKVLVAPEIVVERRIPHLVAPHHDGCVGRQAAELVRASVEPIRGADLPFYQADGLPPPLLEEVRPHVPRLELPPVAPALEPGRVWVRDLAEQVVVARIHPVVEHVHGVLAADGAQGPGERVRLQHRTVVRAAEDRV